ncbi:MAG: phosphoribosylanthranilate isomerase [Bacteroides sp.]|nr:phosphoribosylanthranilate isomerase [Bacteroides sp.]
MNIKIKLCGIRREEDARYLNEFPPDYAGFVFAESKRRVTLEQAERLSSLLLPSISRVGVFVNHPLEEMKSFAEIIDVYQLHGSEDEGYISRLRKMIPHSCEIWKAVRIRNLSDVTEANGSSADRLLLDAFSANAYGGTGKVFDWDMISGTKISKPFFAAGGINADNLKKAVSSLKPYGIDLSGGIETDGCKDREKIRQIMTLMKRINL